MDHVADVCVFCGELGGDALIHYLRCEPIWTIITPCFRLRVEWIDRSPAQRIGSVDPSMASLLQIVVAVRVYHALRQLARVGSLAQDPNDRILYAMDLIRHYISEIPRRLRAECTVLPCTA